MSEHVDGTGVAVAQDVGARVGLDFSRANTHRGGTVPSRSGADLAKGDNLLDSTNPRVCVILVCVTVIRLPLCACPDKQRGWETSRSHRSATTLDSKLSSKPPKREESDYTGRPGSTPHDRVRRPCTIERIRRGSAHVALRQGQLHGHVETAASERERRMCVERAHPTAHCAMPCGPPLACCWSQVPSQAPQRAQRRSGYCRDRAAPSREEQAQRRVMGVTFNVNERLASPRLGSSARRRADTS